MSISLQFTENDWTRLEQDYDDRLSLIGKVDCAMVLVDGPVESVRAQTE